MSHILYGTLDIASGTLPFIGAEFVKLHTAVITGAYIFGYKIKLSNRYIKLICTCVLYRNVILGNAVEFKLAYTDETSYSV